MKSFKVDGFKFAILPILIVVIMLLYAFLFLKNTPMHINIINISLDIIILLIYFRMFVYELNVDSQGVDLKGVFVKKRVLVSELKSLKQGGILTLIKTEKGRFFLLSSKKEREIVKKMFKDI